MEFELDADLTLSMPTSIGFAHGDDESGWSAKSSKGSKSGKSIKVLPPVDGLISAWVQYTGSVAKDVNFLTMPAKITSDA